MTASKKKIVLLVFCAILVVVAAVLMVDQTAFAASAEPTGYYWKANGVVIADNTLTVKRGASISNITFWHNGQQVTDGAIKASVQSQSYVTVTNNTVSTKSNTPLTYDASSVQVVEWVFDNNTKISGAELKLKMLPSTKVTLSVADVYNYKYNISNINIINTETVTVTVQGTNYKGGTTNQTTTLTSSAQNNIEFYGYAYFMSETVKLKVISMRYTSGDKSVAYTIEQYPDLFTGASISLTGYFTSGTGTTAEPYQISNERELRNIEKSKTYSGSSEYVTSHFVLTKDITLTSAWTPVQASFTGTFDGAGKTISDLKITVTGTRSRYAFFEVLNSGTVQNVTFDNAEVKCTDSNNYIAASIGIIVGYNLGTIKNCEVKGTVDISRYNAYVGGIVGSNYGTIYKCNNHANITGSGNIGGIAGLTSGSGTEISYCNNYGIISYKYNTQNGTAGGIVGLSEQFADISHCGNSNTIKYASEKSDNKEIAPCMAQIIGWNYSGLTPTYCSMLSHEEENIKPVDERIIITDYANLQKVGSIFNRVNQARYCTDVAVGWKGVKS